jgi:hypothetical protein
MIVAKLIGRRCGFCWLGVVLALACGGGEAARAAGPPVGVGSGLQLLVDDALVDRLDGPHFIGRFLLPDSFREPVSSQ